MLATEILAMTIPAFGQLLKKALKLMARTDMAHHAAIEAGYRNMHEGNRAQWNDEDHQVALDTFTRLQDAQPRE